MNEAWEIFGNRKRVGGGVLAVLVASALGACEPAGPGSGPSFQIRDSAGVQVVESHRPLLEREEAWTVASEALLRIGVVEGDPAYQFSQVTGAVRLADGTVAVADFGSQEVRFFRPDGDHVVSVGGPGEGPGEFTGLSALGKDGEGGIWAYDFSLRRITWMDGTGRIRGLTSLGLEPAMLAPVGPLPDNTFLLKQLWGAEQTAASSAEGLRRDPIAFVRFSESGELADTLGLFPGREVYLLEEEGRGVMSTPPFARNTVATILDGGVVVGTMERFELLELAPDGSLRRVVRIPGREELVSREDLEAYLQGRLEGAPPEAHASIRRSVEEMPVPETIPPYGTILTDLAGNLWVAEWSMMPRLPKQWTVFDEAGAWLGEVLMPDGFYPQDIGKDWILGVEVDELDVEHIVVRGLHKG